MMKLSLEQIQSITFGAVRIWQENDGIHFSRCSESQIRYWYSVRESLGDRSTRTTGVCLDFHTDSNRVACTFAGANHFDIYVDGILSYCHQAASPDFSILLPAGEHRVTVIFPSHDHDRPYLQKLDLDDGATLRSHCFDRKILFLGDSITQGWGSSCDSLSWAWNVSLALNAEGVNQGIGGSCAEPGTFPNDVPFDPDTVIVSYGTNDWDTRPTLESLKETYGRYLDLVCEKYAGKKLIAISPIYRFHTEEGRSMGSFESCCEVIKQCIRDHGMLLVDGFELIPHQEMFFMDGVHPVDIGYRTFFEQLMKYL